jgi:hypothetical protein
MRRHWFEFEQIDYRERQFSDEISRSKRRKTNSATKSPKTKEGTPAISARSRKVVDKLVTDRGLGIAVSLRLLGSRSVEREFAGFGTGPPPADRSKFSARQFRCKSLRPKASPLSFRFLVFFKVNSSSSELSLSVSLGSFAPFLVLTPRRREITNSFSSVTQSTIEASQNNISICFASAIAFLSQLEAPEAKPEATALQTSLCCLYPDFIQSASQK